MKTTKINSKTVIQIAAIISVVMIIFPPWREFTGSISRPLGYYFLFASPDATSSRLGISIDYGRLCLQLLIIALVTTFALTWLKSKDNT